MAKVVDHILSDQSSDNEELNRLFPKCRPKHPNAFNDVNQNSLITDSMFSSPPDSNSLVSTPDRANENFMDGRRLSIGGSSDKSDLSVGKRTKDFKGISRTNHSSQEEEDSSVVSGYDQFGVDCSAVCDHKGDNSVCDKQDPLSQMVYDPELDIGYHLKPNFCLKESRIEIAGGREIFSKSRCKPSKKRHSDEVVYHVPLGCDRQVPCELKRRSGEVLYDDKLSRYIYELHSVSADKSVLVSNNKTGKTVSHLRTSSLGKLDDTLYPVDGHKDMWLERKLSMGKKFAQSEQQELALSSGHLVYEAPVLNAEVVYDDIGELIDHQKFRNESGLLQVKMPNNEEVFLDSLSKTLLSSPTSNGHTIEEEGRTANCSSKNSGYDCVSANSKSSLGSGSDGDQKSPNQLSAEEMDTESEPPSPDKYGIARVIGTVPIAQYEGSPRRYGPRPGYPFRIVTTLEDGIEEQCKKQDTEIDGDHLKDTAPKPSPCSSLENITCSNSTQIGASMNGRQEKSTHYDSPLGGDHSQSPDSGTGRATSELDQDRSPKDSPLYDTDFNELEYRLYRVNAGSSYIGKRLAQSTADSEDSPKRSDPKCPNGKITESNSEDVSPSHGFSDAYLPNEHELMLLHERVHQHMLHVEMAENDRESLSTYPGTEDLGETEVGEQVDHTRNFTLSPETTDCDSNDVESEVSFEGSLNSGGRLLSSMPVLEDGLSSGHSSEVEVEVDKCSPDEMEPAENWIRNRSDGGENPALLLMKKQITEIEREIAKRAQRMDQSKNCSYHDVEEYLQKHSSSQVSPLPDIDLSYFDSLAEKPGLPCSDGLSAGEEDDLVPLDRGVSRREAVSEAIREIKQAIQKSKTIQLKSTVTEQRDSSTQPVWIPRLSQPGKSPRPDEKKQDMQEHPVDEECDTDQETDRLLGAQRCDDRGYFEDKAQNSTGKKKATSKEVLIHEPAVLIEGVLFRARYLGSTQLVCEGQPTKATRMMQAEEAVSRIKAPEGETQPSTEVDLFISTEKIMVLNTDLKEIMMDHALRTISYIADIGDLVVLMARRRMINPGEDPSEIKIKKTPKMICHVFESEEAQFIAQSIGQAFQVAYLEFLKANGIEDSSFVKEMDYQEVLNSQEIFGNELEMFAKKEKQKEVIVPKQKAEILGMVIVESGWGSMLPTVVIANMAQSGPAARCGQLNIGDQIIAINGISLVGLPLSTCQNYIKNTKNQTVVKLTVVPCAPVVEVKIKRPDTKYQLGFSVQNGVICSLLRGGIAERGGVRVGHRIIEINGQSVVAVPHEKIVNLLATSVGEIHMKTMPTSMFRLLTGQEAPVYI